MDFPQALCGLTITLIANAWDEDLRATFPQANSPRKSGFFRQSWRIGVILFASHGRCLLPEDPPDRLYAGRSGIFIEAPDAWMPRPPENLAQTSGRGLLFCPADCRVRVHCAPAPRPRRAQTVPQRKQQGRKRRRKFRAVNFSEGDAGEGNERLPRWRSAGC